MNGLRLHLPALLLLATPALGNQQPAPQDGPAPAPDEASAEDPGPSPQITSIEQLYGRWLDLDGVAIVVNSDIITQTSIDRKFQQRLTEEKVTTNDEARMLRTQTSLDEVKLLLMRQAGEDLGLSEEAIESNVIGSMRDEKDQAGGSYEMARKHREDNTTATEAREDRVTEIYEQSWKRRIAGYGGAAERSPEDRYIRPGTLTQRYLRINRTGRDIRYLQRAGASAATYEVQCLLLTGDAFESMELAAKKSVSILKALRTGDTDWDEMIDSLGALPNRGLSGPRTIEFIQGVLDPGDNSLLQFVMDGRQNVYSEVIGYPVVHPTTGERRLVGFAIYKLVARTAAELPPFSNPEVQTDLRRWIEFEGDQVRWDDAVSELQSLAYVWYPGIEKEKEALAVRRQEREVAIQKARDENAKKLRQGSKSD